MNKPEALRLADVAIFDRSIGWQADATAELRRLHAECNDLAHQLNESNERNGRIVAQRDAMQERAEYWKRKHDDEETGAERYALRVQRDALLEALKAAVADWDTEVSKGRWLDAARAAIAKAEEETR